MIRIEQYHLHVHVAERTTRCRRTLRMNQKKTATSSVSLFSRLLQPSPSYRVLFELISVQKAVDGCNFPGAVGLFVQRIAQIQADALPAKSTCRPTLHPVSTGNGPSHCLT